MTNYILHRPESKVQGRDETWGQRKGDSPSGFSSESRKDKDDWLKAIF